MLELISVIIPVYNVKDYLDRCITSVINQTYSKLEIILIDDGSTDGSSTICDKWVKEDGRIQVIHKKNGGLSDARNQGLRVAKGELISFVDSDDWLGLEFYERLVNAINNDNSDIAACTVEMVWEDKETHQLLTVCENTVLNNNEAQTALLLETKLKQPVWYKIYKREVIRALYFETGKQHEDVFWSYQAIGNAARVSLIDYVGYYYWQRMNSIMSRAYSIKHLDAVEAYCNRYEYIKDHYPELETKAKTSILSGCIYQGQMILLNLPKKDQRHAFVILEGIAKKYPIKHQDLTHMKCTHRLWLQMARISLRFVCRVKNSLKVGY